MKISKSTYCACLLGSVIVASMSVDVQANLIAYDGFNYAADTTVPDTASSAVLNGGTGFNSGQKGWSDVVADSNGNSYVTTNAGLAYTTSSGGTLTVAGNALSAGNDTLGAKRCMAAGISYSTAGTYYFSYLFKASSVAVQNPSGQNYLGVHVAGTYMGLNLNGSAMSFTIGKAYGSSPAFATTVTPVANQTYLLVAKIVIDPAGNETLSMWINPSVSSENNAGTPDAINTSIDFNSGTDMWWFNVYQSSTVYGLTVDELRLGTTWADVTPGLPASVPEPAALGLAGVAAGGLLFRRVPK